MFSFKKAAKLQFQDLTLTNTQELHLTRFNIEYNARWNTFEATMTFKDKVKEGKSEQVIEVSAKSWDKLIDKLDYQISVINSLKETI